MKKKLYSLSPRANYTYCLSAKLVTTFVASECRVVRATDPLRPYSRISRPDRYFFPSSSSSNVLTRLSTRVDDCQMLFLSLTDILNDVQFVRLSVQTFSYHSPRSNIWNTTVKLFLKHHALWSYNSTVSVESCLIKYMGQLDFVNSKSEFYCSTNKKKFKFFFGAVVAKHLLVREFTNILKTI
jgi:hypothetical protein